MAARRLRDELLARRGRGDTVAPDPRLRFAEAADLWLAGPVLDLRQSTQAKYRSALGQHLRPRFGGRRLDSITADDLATLVRRMRDEGKSEATIAIVLGVVGRIYKFAARRLGWHGTNPTMLLLSSERPKVSLAKRRPIFTPEQIEQTIAAATKPYRTMFTLAALTGARMSELCGLTWSDVRLDDVDDAEVTFGWQVDRKGNRRATKTDGSARTVPIPRELALVLVRHKLASHDTRPEAFVFATRSGRPLGQRNVQRALRKAQERATDESGRPTFPILHKEDAEGLPAPVPPLPCPRCTPSVTQSPRGLCSRARAWMRWHSSSGIGMPRSRVSSTSARSQMRGDARCADRGCSPSTAVSYVLLSRRVKVRIRSWKFHCSADSARSVKARVLGAALDRTGLGVTGCPRVCHELIDAADVRYDAGIDGERRKNRGKAFCCARAELRIEDEQIIVAVAVEPSYERRFNGVLARRKHVQQSGSLSTGDRRRDEPLVSLQPP